MNYRSALECPPDEVGRNRVDIGIGLSLAPALAVGVSEEMFVL